jgi:hypothetical protein
MKLTWVDRKYGRVCKKCGKRHTGISTPGHNLPKDSNDCKEKC